MILLVNKIIGNNAAASATCATSSWVATAGNLIFVIARGAANGDTISISDTAGNTYTPIGSLIDNSGLGDGAIWYAKNIIGNAANVITCTWKLSGSNDTTVTFKGIIALEYSGLDPLSPLDVNTTPISTVGTSAGATSNSFSTIYPNEVIIGAACYDNGTAAASKLIGGSTATLEQDIAATIAVEDLIVLSTQSSITAAISSTGTGDWIFFTVSFKAAGANDMLMMFR